MGWVALMDTYAWLGTRYLSTKNNGWLVGFRWMVELGNENRDMNLPTE